MEQKKYRYRNLARVIIEAASPIAVGSGDKDFITDAPILKDVNELPYIPGTSIAGVIRHAIGHSEANKFFGYNDRNKSENSLGSKIIFSNALMVGHSGKVIEGISDIDFSDDFYKNFTALPIRQHNSINSKGTVKKTGKFDEQVAYKGCRFCFEIEMLSETEKDANFKEIIQTLQTSELRFGGGTRTGFGEIKIVSLHLQELDLTKDSDIQAYIKKSSSLNEDKFWTNESKTAIDNLNNSVGNWTKYELKLKPDDFFLFGSGFGSDDADMTPVYESVITWKENNTPKFEEEYVLIPATSVKGTISHRVAFHYNRLTKVFADKLPKDDFEKHVGENNIAVKELFGASGESNDKQQIRGKVILSDVLLNKKYFNEKVLNHVSIDRFTGGAIDGALFQEEVLYGNDYEFSLKLLVEPKDYSEKVIEAFEATLTDITTGMLPLGGGVNRGHGSFNGVVLIDGKPLKM